MQTPTNIDSSFGTIVDSGQPWRQQYDINLEDSKDITEWIKVGNLPVKLWGSSAIVTKNRVYLLGGNSRLWVVSTIFTATIADDGTIGEWRESGKLPTTSAYSSIAVIKDRLYLLGGIDDSDADRSIVYVATINSDGTLGAWREAGILFIGINSSCVVVTNSRVYLLGGINGNAITSTVQSASIDSDGSLGTWVKDNNIPIALCHSSVAVTKDRVYLLGGYSPDGFISTIYTAPINDIGVIGQWREAGNLPSALAATSVIVTRNRVFLIGGYNASDVISTIFSAAINTDGTLGVWSESGNLPNALSHSSAIVVKNKVHLLGGRSNKIISDIYSTSIAGGLNDYSEFYQ